MRVPTVKMYKGSRIVTVNEGEDSIKLGEHGWSREDESTKPTGQAKQDEPQLQPDVDDVVLGVDVE